MYFFSIPNINPSIQNFLYRTPLDYSMPMTYAIRPHALQNYIPFQEFITRMKRQSLRQDENLDFEEEEKEEKYNSSQLFKVRLSIGPIVINKPLVENGEEDISCSLVLMNSRDNGAHDFSSTIHKKVSFPSNVPTKFPEIKEDTLHVDPNHKKEVLFLIDSNSISSSTKRSKSDDALENIRNIGISRSDHLLASSCNEISIHLFNWLILGLSLWTILLQ